eukprot:TRINITY_DN26037_c0_g1_i1.p1 TRINITY_DN26037_c0_g1~~TRINITY_DN26037_c0_g1_i1.p1  ORF type:complete len:344 (-),score=40.20 TRINITY_DN26037_c0_g1_i1:177-1208(-)
MLVMEEPNNVAFRRAALRSMIAIVVVTVIAFIALLFVPPLVTTGILAYTFGLRHAVDADHIAAIDNVTRKLTINGEQPTTVGLFFALGHSCVVFLVCCGIAIAGNSFRTRLADFTEMGGNVAVSISGIFLLFIGCVNLYMAWNLRKAQSKDSPDGKHHHALAGVVTRCFPTIFNAIKHPWQMTLIGFLFGLGFDTSSEVALLGIVAVSVGDVPKASILLLPLLFAAGMSLLDNLNGILMALAYGGALNNKSLLFQYTLLLTLVSAFVAIAVGSVELLGLLCQTFNLHGGFADFISYISDHFELIGGSVVVLFLLSFLCALVYLGVSRKNSNPSSDSPTTRFLS